MELDTAIETLSDLELSDDLDLEPHEKCALKLGIQALKWRLHQEKADPHFTYRPLPGETERSEHE